MVGSEKVSISKEMLELIAEGKVKILRNKRLRFGKYKILKVYRVKGLQSWE